MSKHDFWLKARNRIDTDIGKWTGGVGVDVRGYSLFDDLFNKISYMQMLVLNATGKMITAELGKWLENNFMCMSYPDARIWCNQMGAFAANTHSSPTAATVAGCLAADSRVYGGSQTSEYAMTFIQQALQRHQTGETIEQIVASVPVKQGKPAIVGFARPVARTDERIEPHREMSQSLGFEIGPHMALANAISEYTEKHFNMGINIGGYTGAFMSDQGFTPREVYLIKNLCVASGVTATYTDNQKPQRKSFLPLQCDDVAYTGHAKRSVV